MVYICSDCEKKSLLTVGDFFARFDNIITKTLLNEKFYNLKFFCNSPNFKYLSGRKSNLLLKNFDDLLNYTNIMIGNLPVLVET